MGRAQLAHLRSIGRPLLYWESIEGDARLRDHFVAALRLNLLRSSSHVAKFLMVSRMLGPHPLVPPGEIEAIIGVEAAVVVQIVVHRGVDPAGERRIQPPAREEFEPGMAHRVADDLEIEPGEHHPARRRHEELP